MKKNVIIAGLSIIVLIATYLLFVNEPKIMDESELIETKQFVLDSITMADIYKTEPEKMMSGDVIIIEINLRRICYRDIMQRAWGTYYPVARSYWRATREPYLCKYIRIDHSIYGKKTKNNTSSNGFIPQQRRHCRAHHLKAWFNPFGGKEYFLELGQN